MAMLRRMNVKERIIGRIEHGADLLEALGGLCRERDIRLGWFEGLGAVKKAALSFYDQQTHEYRVVEIDRPLEITGLAGNISVKEGAPFVHAHVTFADDAGRAFGGHLAAGTIVFACEIMIEVLDGPVLERLFDETTGLSLWSMPE
jgi:predicted DNA-binding protein with PD1-like motif